MIFGASVCGTLGTLQTRKSPSDVCVASMSVFCLEEEPCHAKSVIREGDLVVFRVWSMVKDGCKVAIKMLPLR